jgi:hypothetical protein
MKGASVDQTDQHGSTALPKYVLCF